jgi:hypothetical protein
LISFYKFWLVFIVFSIFHSKFINLRSLNHQIIKHIRDLWDYPCVDPHRYLQMDAEIALKLLCHRVAVKSKHSLFSALLKSRMFMSEFNKDFWCVCLSIYFLRIVRWKVNQGRKTLSDLKLQIQMMSTKLHFNEATRKCCRYAWMIQTMCIFSLLCEVVWSLVIESVFECLRVIKSRFASKSCIFL